MVSHEIAYSIVFAMSDDLFHGHVHTLCRSRFCCMGNIEVITGHMDGICGICGAGGVGGCILYVCGGGVTIWFVFGM